MAPIPKLEKTQVSAERAPKPYEPSTWKVLTLIGGSLYFTYSIYSTAEKIWKWAQTKIKNSERAEAERQNRLIRRNTHLEKRWAPFDATINVLYWVQRVVLWIYYQADMLPVRIQNSVDRNYKTTQDDLWEHKNDEADDNVKIILAKEFPEYFKKKFLDPFEEGSDLYEENKRILEEDKKELQQRTINITEENTEIQWD